MSPTPTSGPEAVLNGSTIATATSHWVSTQCRVQVELTSDYGFFSVVVNSAGTTSSGSFIWTPGSQPNSVSVNGSSGLKGFSWVSELLNISGSTSSNAFTADAVVESNATPQSLGTCTFALAQGTL